MPNRVMPRPANPPSPESNHLLAVLPADIRDRLVLQLELVSLPLGEALYESGGRLESVYFPTDAIVSLLNVTENGASAEIAVVGNEGLSVSVKVVVALVMSSLFRFGAPL